MQNTSAPAPVYSGLQAKILNFLGSGIEPARVASAVGCDPSYISQLLAQDEFAAAVSDKRLAALTEATTRDARLNGIEDSLISRTEELVKSPLAFSRPMEAIRALHTVNSMKRRGAGQDTTTHQHTTVVQLVLPQVVRDKFAVPSDPLDEFTLDINNQVIKTGQQTLVTIASGGVQGLATSLLPDSYKEISHESNSSKRIDYAKLSAEDLL